MFLHHGNIIINLDKVEMITFEGDSIDFVFDVDELKDNDTNPKCFTIWEPDVESATDLYEKILKGLDDSRQLIVSYKEDKK